MSNIIIGETVTKVVDDHAEFMQAHVLVPSRSMHDRVAHGYFDINLDVVLETTQERLPELFKQLPAVLQAAHYGFRNDNRGKS